MIAALGFLAFTVSIQPDLLASGQAALRAGDLPGAELAFRAYLQSNPNSAEGLSNLAAVHSRREQYQEAIQLYEKALKANPRLYPIHFNLAVTMIRVKDPRAIGHLRAFLQQQPDEPRARQLLGLCLVEAGDNRSAITELESVYRRSPQDPSILASLAYAHARGGNEDRALDLLSRMDANPVQANLLKGLVEYRRGRFAEAKDLLRRVVDASPDNPQAVAALGRLHLLENDDAEAIRLLDSAVKLNPTDAESWYQIGVLHARNERVDQGIPCLRKALSLRANYADPHYQLGRIAFDRKEYSGALREFEEARRILPNQEAIRLMLGRTYQALGRDSEAKAEFEEVRRLKAAVIERDRQRVESDALMR